MIVYLANKTRFREAPVPPEAESHQIVAEVEVRATVMNHLEQILSFST
jgi:hypothetical protein